MTARHGVRGAEPRRRARRQPAGRAERQRHVDLGERRRAVELLRARARRQDLRGAARRRQEDPAAHAHGLGARAALRGTHEGHGAARHAVRGDGLQLHRPDRRPRPRRAGRRRCATCATCEGPQFLHVVTRKGKGYAPAEADPIKWHGPGPFDAAQRHDLQGKGHRPDLLAGVRPVAVRHGRARPARRRHHAGDARRLRPGRVLEALPGPLFRRRHRRAARGDARGRARLRGRCGRWSRSTRRSCSAPTTS